MPVYTVHDKNTDETYDVTLKIAEYEELMESSPHLERVWCSAPAICDPIRVGIGAKPDAGFRDLLKRTKREHRNLLSGGTNINDF